MIADLNDEKCVLSKISQLLNIKMYPQIASFRKKILFFLYTFETQMLMIR